MITAQRQRRLPRIGRRHAALALAAVLLAGGLVGAAVVALTGSTGPSRRPLESMLQDDQRLVYSSTPVLERTLRTLKAIGVDRVRITVKWSDIAPDPSSRTAPRGFRASDPSAYAESAIAAYDRIDVLAARSGIGVDFDLTAPAPLWATRPLAGVPAHDADVTAPSARAFGRFVTALGRRYDGRFRIRAAPGGPEVTLPRVGFWSVWNEPNQPGWLAPQYRRGHRQVPEAPALYRAYADAAYAGLRATGHGGDRILIGELAPEGCTGAGAGTCFYAPSLEPIPPIPFVRSLYCLDASYRPLRGAAAAALGCPRDGSPAGFVAAHPVLFHASAFAHHPYSFFVAPSVSLPERSFVPLADLGRLEGTLDRAFAAYGSTRRIPLYLDEYGYETDPPNPTARGMKLSAQASYLDEATYLAWRDPRVEGLSQFLLVDSPPDRRFPKGSPGYWSTFQTGLEFVSGRPKPSLAAYRLALWLPHPAVAPGVPVRVWAMLRAAPAGTPQTAEIQWRAPGGRWRTIAHVSTTRLDGVLQAGVVVPGSGRLRVRWTAPGGAEEFSRAASVRVGAR